jgi:hypothetical protein
MNALTQPNLIKEAKIKSRQCYFYYFTLRDTEKIWKPFRTVQRYG